jgi:hypothetical protein
MNTILAKPDIPTPLAQNVPTERIGFILIFYPQIVPTGRKSGWKDL